jgi:hypothetical protein
MITGCEVCSDAEIPFNTVACSIRERLTKQEVRLFSLVHEARTESARFSSAFPQLFLSFSSSFLLLRSDSL